MLPNPQETGDLVTFTEEIRYGKLHFLGSVILALLSFGRNHFLEIILKYQRICFQEHFLAAVFDARNFRIISKYTTISNRRVRALCLKVVCQNSAFLQIFRSTFFYLEFLKKSTKSSRVYLESSLRRTYTKKLAEILKILISFITYACGAGVTFEQLHHTANFQYDYHRWFKRCLIPHHFKCLFSLELAFSLSSPISGSSVSKIW